MNEVLPTLIPEIAQEVGIPLDNIFDLYTLMGTKDDLETQFNCNPQCCGYWMPNDAGNSFIASKIYKKLLDPKPKG